MEYTSGSIKKLMGRNTVYIEVIECLKRKGAPRRIVLRLMSLKLKTSSDLLYWPMTMFKNVYFL